MDKSLWEKEEDYQHAKIVPARLTSQLPRSHSGAIIVWRCTLFPPASSQSQFKVSWIELKITSKLSMGWCMSWLWGNSWPKQLLAHHSIDMWRKDLFCPHVMHQILSMMEFIATPLLVFGGYPVAPHTVCSSIWVSLSKESTLCAGHLDRVIWPIPHLSIRWCLTVWPGVMRLSFHWASSQKASKRLEHSIIERAVGPVGKGKDQTWENIETSCLTTFCLIRFPIVSAICIYL